MFVWESDTFVWKEVGILGGTFMSIEHQDLNLTNGRQGASYEGPSCLGVHEVCRV